MTNPPTPARSSLDARNRAVRTFVQNLLIDVLVAVVLFLWPLVSSAQSLEDFDWPVLIFSFIKTIIATIVAYLMRVLGVSPQTTTS